MVKGVDADAEMLAYALSIGLPIVDEVPTELHYTERNSPVQCAGFLRILMHGYRVHLDKNKDYSPANILGTGFLGTTVRMWDKMARIMNLTGFKLHISKPAEFVGAKEATNEALEDSYWDMFVYAIIAILLRRNEWGR